MFVYRKIEQFDFELYVDSPRPMAKRQKEERKDEESMLNDLRKVLSKMKTFNQQLDNELRRMDNEFEDLLNKY